MLALGRDGLVPNSFFGAVHPKWRTPWKSTILTGLFVAAMAGFIPLSILAEMTSIGTLFAFVIVCAAVLVMRRTNPNAKRPFRAPFVPLVPILGILTCLLLMFSLPYENWIRLIVWLLIGLIIYFLYGRRHSVMSRHTDHEIRSHGVSPAGQAVGDPDAPPSSPAAPVDSRVP
jgi:APA family basic amino acid/polyamine antiporter